MGGGNEVGYRTETGMVGLSPRGRGKPGLETEATVKSRSIPAWAGETSASLVCAWAMKVYPRVGGGNRFERALPDLPKGLSPRGRGKLFLPVGENVFGQVYPRVGGGNSVAICGVVAIIGLSPRGRGKRGGHRRITAGGGSIPAWAGETVSCSLRECRIQVYPRVGGGNRCMLWRRQQKSGLSPRGRGKQLRLYPARRVAGSIPAWAGETRRACLGGRPSAVYPRVGGGNHPKSLLEVL